MNLTTWYSTGTASVESGSTTVTGVGLFWGEDAIMAGDLFCDPAQPLVPPQRVLEVTSDTTLELWAPWPGADMTAAAYEIRYAGIIERSTAQTRKVLEQLGEVSAYFDVQVDTLADRDDYDARPGGFRVLVSDIGDGRSAIYSKMSSVEADWSEGAVLGDIGPAGPAPNLAAGAVTTLPNGTPATATISGINPNYLLNLGLPEGPDGPLGPRGDRGINWRGPWSVADEYEVADVVTDDDISGDPAAWIALGDSLSSRPRDNPDDWAYFPGSFPATQDYGLITEMPTDYDDYGVIA